MKTYWNNQGKFQKTYGKLCELITAISPVDDCSPHLENLRLANNAYYDIFNNGGGNRDSDILKFFDLQFYNENGEFIGEQYQTVMGEYDWSQIHSKTEKIMNDLILKAGKEQNIRIEEIVFDFVNQTVLIDPKIIPGEEQAYKKAIIRLTIEEIKNKGLWNVLFE